MFRYVLHALPPLTLLLSLPVGVQAQDSTRDAKAVAEVRAAVRSYDEALRRADPAAAGRFWAPEFIFVNPRGERLTREDRLANLRASRTNSIPWRMLHRRSRSASMATARWRCTRPC